jgi:dihydrofolate reductase
MITFVWAEDENGVIGKDGTLPWNLPNDMKFFKEVTLTGNILMGRKTFESIPNPPLPHRKNVVMTRNEQFEYEGVTVFHSKEEVLKYAEESDRPLHIIGGAVIFDLFVNEVDKLYRTLIHDSFDGDTFMSPIDYSQFDLVEEKEGTVDEKNKHAHTFQIFERKQK